MKNSVIYILFITTIIEGCSPQPKKPYQHDYIKFYEKYEQSLLIDSLYSDTLSIGTDSEGNRTITPFYISKIEELIADLKDDWNEIDSLYPGVEFDEISIQKIPIGNKYSLDKKRMDRLLSIVNNPTNFNWSESTDSPGFVVGFNRNGERISSFLISDDFAEVYPFPDWPKFKKMKFGALKCNAQKELHNLFIEIGYK